MKIRSLALGAAILATAATIALAHQASKEDLGHYYPIRAALAADKTEGIKEHAEALAKSKDKGVATAASTIYHHAADLAAVRKAFGDLSKALIDAVEHGAKKGVDVGTVHVFECPMAKPYGKWLQEDEDMGNPYYGSEMLKCGKKVATFGGGEKKPDGEEGHGKQGGHGGGHH